MFCSPRLPRLSKWMLRIVSRDYGDGVDTIVKGCNTNFLKRIISDALETLFGKNTSATLLLKGPTHLWDFLKNIIRCSTLLVRTQLQQYIFLFTTSGIVWIWWRHYCKRTRTQVWPFIAYTHRKGWRSIVASSINVDEFICLFFFWHIKEKIWRSTVFGWK